MSRFKMKNGFRGLPGGFLDREAKRAIREGRSALAAEYMLLREEARKSDIRQIVEECVRDFNARKKKK